MSIYSLGFKELTGSLNAAACAALSGNYVIASEVTITQIATIPTGVYIRIEYGGTIKLDADTTINAKIEAGRYTIFSGVGALTMSDNIVFPEWFGAIGDFNGTTGTNDIVAIQSAINAVATYGGEVSFDSTKNYYASGTASYGWSVLEIGTPTAAAKNVHLIGNGATLYQGTGGQYKFIAVHNATGTLISGFKIYGYTGGTLASTRENDAIITIGYSSKDTTIEHNYLTNSLGDCIYAGGALHIAGGGTGYTTQQLTVRHNVLKERYGNGTQSYSSGTRSRDCIALIDVIDADIHNNIIYGRILCEPNLDNQYIKNVDIQHNEFKSGHVTPQAVIGTTYWFDEPTAETGGTTMEQDVAYESVAGSPIFTGGCVSNNNFEYASIRLLGFLPSQVSNNTFYTGLIRVGSTSGSNALYSANISSNRALLPLGANTCFIKLEGYVYQSVFQNNSCFNTFTYCINNNGASTGDNGGNVFIGNTVTNAGTSGVAHTKHYQSQYYNNTNQDVPVSVTLSGSTSAPIDYNSYVGRTWLTVQTATATPTISNITNVPADGTFLTIMSGANGGGGTTTIANTANVALKGGVNAVMPIYGTISFIARAATFFEISRNF